MKTLLALINQPENSKNFIRYTIQLAKYISANLELISIQNPDIYPLGTPGSMGGAVVQVQENLERIAEKANNAILKNIEEVKTEIGENIPVFYSSEIGSTTLILEDKVSEKKNYMIVLEGQRDEGYWNQNPINMDIIRRVKCPVWIISPDKSFDPYRKILYATDYKKEDFDTLKKLTGLSKSFSLKITALHITDNLDFEEKLKETGFHELVKQETGSDNISIVTYIDSDHKEVPEIINKFASEIEANLITVHQENRHFLDRIFKSGFTYKIIKQAKLPVLVYHDHTDQ